MIRGEILKLVNELVSQSQRMDSADLSVDNMHTSLELLKHRYVCLSQEVDA